MRRRISRLSGLRMNSVAVIGAGAWGTALALHLARAGRTVTLWARDAGLQERRVSNRLPGVVLPASILVTPDLPEADVVLLAVPVQHLRSVVARLPPGGPLVMCAKGVEAYRLLLPLEILAELHPGRPAAVLSGPNFAHEIAAGLPAAAVVAGTNPGVRANVIGALATPGFRLYGNGDPIGAQAGGAAKNVIAIAAGAVIGAGLGENARAALVTRGLAEISRFAVALGGRADTVAGLSGLGDLFRTCAGPASRNYSLGLELGAGVPLAAILGARTAVTEGVVTAPALLARAASVGVSLPICAAVVALLDGTKTIRGSIDAILSRPLRDE